MDLSRNRYLTKGIIAYLGNKRRLLPILAESFERLAGESDQVSFADAFAGSGVVSRLARYLGYRVSSNDWEPYAEVLSRASLLHSPDSADQALSSLGGIEAAISHLNAVGDRAAEAGLAPSEAYISRHFAPADTEGADYRRERLFYTAENARRIDAVRHEIARLTSGSDSAEALLLAPLIAEASRRANTSGVFKAYHKGFGGHGRDALGRILSPLRLEAPALIGGPPAAGVFRKDAADFLASGSFDLVYIDPPYNTHQYGSNYFMLNTIALWDRPSVDSTRRADGSLQAKAGIRRDWAERKSPFCSRASVRAAFKGLIAAADARHIVISYGSAGLLEIEELVELLSDRAEVELIPTAYPTYRGGRQSRRRAVSTTELLIVAHRRGLDRPISSDGRAAAADSAARAARAAPAASGASAPAAPAPTASNYATPATPASNTATPAAGADSARRGSAALPAAAPDAPAAPAAVAISAGGASAQLRRLRLEERCTQVLRARLVPSRLSAYVREQGGVILGGFRLSLTSDYRLALPGESSPAAALAAADDQELSAFLASTEAAVCRDHLEEASILVALIGRSEVARGERLTTEEKRLLVCARKLAHKKYRSEFETLCGRIEAVLAPAPERRALRRGLAELRELYAKRVAG